jgi:hypothetical protein
MKFMLWYSTTPSGWSSRAADLELGIDQPMSATLFFGAAGAAHDLLTPRSASSGRATRRARR